MASIDHIDQHLISIESRINRQNIDNETRLLAYDYIDCCLRHNGFDWPNRPVEFIPDSPTDLMQRVRSICDDFNEKYVRDFGNDREILLALPLSSADGLSRTFSCICNSLFRPDGQDAIEVTWGRIFSLFAFSGSLALECFNQQIPEQVDQLADLLVTFTRTNLSDWIANKGGWNAVLALSHQRHVETTSFITKTALGGFGAVCGALGVVALAAMLVSRH